MKLASYKASRDGFLGIFNWLIRIRLKGIYSHTEVVFMPEDDVGHLMPDGTCEPVDGMYWCASSVASDKMPEWSPRRAGRTGGVRFKRVLLDSSKWDVVNFKYNPTIAATWFKDRQGSLYDWQQIFGFISWLMPEKSGRYMCSECCAASAGYKDAHRFDPCILHVIALNTN